MSHIEKGVDWGNYVLHEAASKVVLKEEDGSW